MLVCVKVVWLKVFVVPGVGIALRDQLLRLVLLKLFALLMRMLMLLAAKAKEIVRMVINV